MNSVAKIKLRPGFARTAAQVVVLNQLIVSAARDNRNQSARTETLSRGLHLSLGADGVQFGTQGGGSGTGSASNTAQGAFRKSNFAGPTT